MTLGSFVKPFSVITQGELEPQFASKDSCFEQNIKQVYRSNWEVKKHKFGSIWVNLEVYTSKLFKLKIGEKVKNWSFNKIPKKGHYNGIRAWYWNLLKLWMVYMNWINSLSHVVMICPGRLSKHSNWHIKLFIVKTLMIGWRNL